MQLIVQRWSCHLGVGVGGAVVVVVVAVVVGVRFGEVRSTCEGLDEECLQRQLDSRNHRHWNYVVPDRLACGGQSSLWKNLLETYWQGSLHSLRLIGEEITVL